MTGLRRSLPKRAWAHVYRVTGGIVAVSIVISVILTNVMMEVSSNGVNVQGLAVSVIMPIILGGPMTFFLALKHEQLRFANEQLAHMATVDWLTGCLNRGAFTGKVAAYLDRRNQRPGDGGALLIVDADDFKRVNDTFGHHIGDEALRLMAQAIRGAVGRHDLVGRLGGEEFGIFLAEASLETADLAAERVRMAVGAIAFAPDGTPCPLSVSIGGAAYVNRARFADLYRLADQRLYNAKNTGRDRVAMMQAA